MTLPDLPTQQGAYDALCVRGEYIPAHARQIAPLAGVKYTHPTLGAQTVQADIHLLARAKRLYVEGALRGPMSVHRLAAAPASDAAELIEERFDSGLVWGFAGFTKVGVLYSAEARAMRALLGSLKNMNIEPSLISDGGCSEGVLGLSGVLASRFSIPSLGFIPREGLASVGQRTHLVVRMHTYRGREQLVGATPDVLVCVGGADGTRRECEAALGHGSVVILMATRGYDPPSFVESHRRIRVLAEAEYDGRLFVCRSLHEIMSIARQAATTADRTSRVNRPERLETLRHLLAA